MALVDRIEDVMKSITRPPFVYPKTRSTTFPTTQQVESTTTPSISTSSSTSSSLSTVTPTNSPILSTLSNPLQIPANEDILQAVESAFNETMISVNDTSFSADHSSYEEIRNNYTHNNTWIDLALNDTIITNDDYSIFDNTTETMVGDANDTMFANESIQQAISTTMKTFDWMKPTGTEDDVLKMSPPVEVASNYTIYIILGSMLAVLVALTIIMFLIYKAYKSRDDYSLTAGRRVRVHKSNLEEATSSKMDEPDEFEVVDFDKNSYRF